MAHTGRSPLIWAALLALPAPLAAQQTDDGGMRLTFGISQSLGVTHNPNFDPGGNDISPLAATALSLGYLTETRTERVAIDLSGGLRIDDTGVEAATPRLSFGYDRTAADAELSVSGSLQRTTVDSLRSLEDFTTADGTVVLPADIDTLNLDGNRTTGQIGSVLAWGKTAPVGYRLGTSLTTVSYDGDAAATLNDSKTLSVDGGMRLNITPTLQADLGLRYTLYDENGSPQTDRLSGSLGLAFDRPSGDISATLTAAETGSGTRIGFQLGRAFALPGTTLTTAVGVSIAPGGDLQATGQLGYNYILPNGQIDLSASRTFVNTTDGSERRLTIAQASYTRQLTPLSTLQTGFGFTETRDDSDDTARSASIEASQSFQLTPDWSLSAGARVELRDETGLDSARSETIFVLLDRSFSIRP